MNLQSRHLAAILLSAIIISCMIIPACVEIGAVPEFEYDYDFDVDVDEPDTSSMSSPTVTISEGSIDNSGTTDFGSDLSSSGESIADAIKNALTASLLAYWEGETASSIASEIESGNATTKSNIEATITAYESSSTLSGYLPEVTDATITSARISSSARTSETTSVEQVSSTTSTQSTADELDDCKAAALAAYNEGVEEADSLYQVYLQLIEDSYDTKTDKAETQRESLTASATSRHESRIADYLDTYNSTKTIINNLSVSDDIKTILNAGNLSLYGIAYQESYDLYQDELDLINEEVDSIIASLNSKKTELENALTSSYNSAITTLEQEYNTAYNSCHNQGGVNTN